MESVKTRSGKYRCPGGVMDGCWAVGKARDEAAELYGNCGSLV